MATMKNFRVIACTFSVFNTLIYATTGTDYKVGAPDGGWNMNTDLKAWSSSIHFYPGDSFTFNYLPYHDIVEVSKENFDRCSSQNNFAFYTGGFTIITLTTPGTRYFICGVPGHCIAGMKLQIIVNSFGSSFPPPPIPITAPPQSLSPLPLPPISLSLTPTSSPGAPAPAPKRPKKTAPPPRKSTSHSPKYAPDISPILSPTKAPSPSLVLPSPPAPAPAPSLVLPSEIAISEAPAPALAPSSEASVGGRISFSFVVTIGMVIFADLVH